MSQDDDHLQILAIFHFVVAGMAALVALFPTVHLAVGIAMVSGVFTDPKEPFPFALVGWILILLASCWIVLWLVFASCLATAGRFLQRRRNYRFCLVMAGVACLFMPFGTVLGVFGILLLTKEGIKGQFPHPPASTP